MAVFGSFIFGFDTDTIETLRETAKAVTEWKIDIFETNTLTPFPGTPLFDRLEKEGRILTKNWQKYNEGDAVFKLKNMSHDDYDKEGWRITSEQNWGLSTELERMKNSLKLGFYPFITSFFQSRFW